MERSYHRPTGSRSPPSNRSTRRPFVRSSLLIAALALLLGPLLSPAPAQAQGRSWTVAPIARVGGFIPLRTLGKTAGFFQNINPQEQQVLAELGDALQVGGGVEISFPARALRVELLYATTLDGDSNGQIAFCGSPNDPLSGAPLCGNVYTGYSLQTFSADLFTVRGNPSALINPVLSVGLGLRKYDFDTPDCTIYEDIDVTRACLYLEDLWVDGGSLTPIFRIGFGLDLDRGPFALRTSLHPILGRYPGGVGNTEGHGQIDLVVQAGASLRIF